MTNFKDFVKNLYSVDSIYIYLGIALLAVILLFFAMMKSAKKEKKVVVKEEEKPIENIVLVNKEIAVLAPSIEPIAPL